MIVLFVLTCAFTAWQARWAYFLVVVLAMILPACLAAIERRSLGWIIAALAFLPILQDWDKNLWRNEAKVARDGQQRTAVVAVARTGKPAPIEDTQAFLAPWWLSPVVSYWSGQPAVAGGSHESLSGIGERARFFLTTESASRREF